jgi:hypothetical protein
METYKRKFGELSNERCAILYRAIGENLKFKKLNKDNAEPSLF